MLVTVIALIWFISGAGVTPHSSVGLFAQHNWAAKLLWLGHPFPNFPWSHCKERNASSMQTQGRSWVLPAAFWRSPYFLGTGLRAWALSTLESHWLGARWETALRWHTQYQYLLTQCLKAIENTYAFWNSQFSLKTKKRHFFLSERKKPMNQLLKNTMTL